LSKKKEYPYTGVWLVVDDDNKKVRYQMDPSWMDNTTDEEQKIAFSKLAGIVAVYQRAGYAIVEIAKKLKK
jgi:hypothetical protein